MGFWEDAGEALFGTQTQARGQQNAQAGQAGMAAGQAGAGAVGTQAQAAGVAARGLGQGYDVGAQQSMGANAADYMKKAQGAAQELASQQAQQASTKGTQQALRAARSSGLNAGQAALTSGQQAADVYQNALAQGTQQGIQNYMGATGQFAGQGAEMAGRAQAALNSQLQAAGTQGQIGAQQSATGAQQQNQAAQTAQNTWGSIMNAASTAGQLIASDVNVKKNIEPLLDKVMGRKSSNLDAILAKIDPVKFDYKNEPDGTGHIGTIAQQVEESPLKNAVVDTPNGKALDTAELSASYLPIIIELASRLKALEGKK